MQANNSKNDIQYLLGKPTVADEMDDDSKKRCKFAVRNKK